ncbi:reverse transcriptase domain-containing protein [Tanacetum coccineum]
MDATNVDDPIHHRIATINLWEEPMRKKKTMHQGGYRGNYYGRNSSNWRDLQSYHRDENRNSNPANDFVKNQFYNLKTKVEQGQKNHQAAIQDLETKFGRISDHQSSRPTGTLPRNTQTNPKPSTSNERPYRPPPAQNEHVNAVFTRSVEYLALADLGASINLMPYSLYAALSGTTLKPTRMSIRLTNHTYQYPMRVAENMLVQVGKFVFSTDFIILEIEEDDRVPLILGRPFLHTANAIIRV